MNYVKLYNDFVERQRHTEYDPNEEYHQHHIVPKSIGGKDHPCNLVWLTKRQHALAHMLLHKIHLSNSGLYWAMQWFLDQYGPHTRRYFHDMRPSYIGNRDYAWASTSEFRQKQSDNAREGWIADKLLKVEHRADPEYRAKMADKVKTTYKTRAKVAKLPHNGRYAVRPIVADGVEYTSLSECARAFNISPKAVYNRINKDTWPTWYYIR